MATLKIRNITNDNWISFDQFDETRALTAGSYLSGGGDLSANRRFDVDDSLLCLGSRILTAGSYLSGGGDLTTDRRFNVEHSILGSLLAGTFYTETEVDAALAGKVGTSRTLTAGSYLSGGGDLSANRRFDVDSSLLDGRYVGTSRSLTAGSYLSGGGDLTANRRFDVNNSLLDGRYYTETELNAGQLDNRYYTETELNAGQLDNRYYTETEVNTWRSGTTQTEMDYVHGVTSDIQTQLNAKIADSADIIKDTHIDWGSGATQVNTDDIPEGSTNKFMNTAGSYTWTGLHTLDNGATIIDATAWGQAQAARMARNLNATTNQSVLNIQANCTTNTGAGASYEKIGLFVRAKTIDPSTGTLRDMVAVNAKGEIGGTISNGRAWGVSAEANVLTGADGYAVAGEFAINNAGSDQASVGQTTSKYGIHLVALSGNATAGICFDRAGSSVFHKGIHADPVHIGTGANDRFIELAGKFDIDRDGVIRTGIWQGTAIARAYTTAKQGMTKVISRTSGDGDYYCDGTADNVQIQSAIDAVEAAGGGTILLREGTYNIASTLTIDASGVSLVGVGGGNQDPSGTAVTLNWTGGASPVLHLDGSADAVYTISLKDFTIDCNGTATYGIYSNVLRNSRIEHIAIFYPTTVGLWLGTTLDNHSTHFNVFKQLWIRSDTAGVTPLKLDGATNANPCHNTFINTNIMFAGAYGIDIIQGDNNNFLGTWIYRVSGSGKGVHIGAGPIIGSNQFFHLQSPGLYTENTTGGDVIWHYDRGNGQPAPTLAAGAKLTWTEDGLNATQWHLETALLRLSDGSKIQGGAGGAATTVRFNSIGDFQTDSVGIRTRRQTVSAGAWPSLSDGELRLVYDGSEIRLCMKHGGSHFYTAALSGYTP